MKFKSVFEIIGPVMVGPSSSHTAGAVKIGQMARKIFGKKPETAEIHFYGSFARTYKGHATDVAVAGGVLGFETDDGRVKESIALAKESGIHMEFFIEEAVVDHPNTVKIILKDHYEVMEIIGISIGGGAIQIIELDGFALKLSGESPALLILHKDAYGTVAAVASVLMKHRINIGHMEVSRMEKGHNALMVIETDQVIQNDIIQEIKHENNIRRVIVLSN
jgi:L-serine dehydratase